MIEDDQEILVEIIRNSKASLSKDAKNWSRI